MPSTAECRLRSPSMSMPVTAPEAELARPRRHAIDAHQPRDVEEVDVARGRERPAHVDRAMTAGLPVALHASVAGREPRAAAVARVERRDDAGFERRDREHRLHRRAGRIDAAQRAVVHRPIRIFGQREVLRAAQAAREQIRIERRRADEGDHVAVRRDRSRPPTLAGRAALPRRPAARAGRWSGTDRCRRPAPAARASPLPCRCARRCGPAR